MNTIKDYLEWRGDLSFDQEPFNELDNYILSKIGCPDCSGIVPEDEREICLTDAVIELFKQGRASEKCLGILASDQIPKTLKMLPDLPRYRNLRLTGYRRYTDEEEVTQFSALTIRIKEDLSFVTFRGTDDSIVGWKENFMMAVMDTVPAQQKALEYLNWAAGKYSGALIVGGHSKGGNLAFYASCRAENSIRMRIPAIYNNDGPGFNDEFFDDPGYLFMKKKMRYIVPQNSIVGTLLLQPCDFTVVKCQNSGIASHDGFGWEVERNHFARADGLSLLSRSFNTALEKTLASMSRKETEVFIDQLFEVLTSNGAKNLTELSEQKLNLLLTTIKSLRRDSAVYAFLKETLENTLKEVKKGVVPSIKGKEIKRKI